MEVVLETSCGDITLLLDPEIAPATVNSFVFLAEQGYYDGIALHRVVPGYIVQIGDPTASGSAITRIPNPRRTASRRLPLPSREWWRWPIGGPTPAAASSS